MLNFHKSLICSIFVVHSAVYEHKSVLCLSYMMLSYMMVMISQDQQFHVAKKVALYILSFIHVVDNETCSYFVHTRLLWRPAAP